MAVHWTARVGPFRHIFYKITVFYHWCVSVKILAATDRRRYIEGKNMEQKLNRKENELYKQSPQTHATSEKVDSDSYETCACGMMLFRPAPLSTSPAKCPCCGAYIGKTTETLIERLKRHFALLRAKMPWQQYQLSVSCIAGMIALSVVLPFLFMTAMLSNMSEEMQLSPGSVEEIALAITGYVIGIPLLVVLSWSAAILATRLGRSKWRWFLGSLMFFGLPTIILFLCPTYLRPAALDQISQDQSKGIRLAFRGSTLRLWVLSFVVLPLLVIWFWPYIALASRPVIFIDGQGYRFRWGKRYAVPMSSGEHSIEVYLPLFPLLFYHWWKASRTRLTVATDNNRQTHLTFRAPWLPWFMGSFVSK